MLREKQALTYSCRVNKNGLKSQTGDCAQGLQDSAKINPWVASFQRPFSTVWKSFAFVVTLEIDEIILIPLMEKTNSMECLN